MNVISKFKSYEDAVIWAQYIQSDYDRPIMVLPKGAFWELVISE